MPAKTKAKAPVARGKAKAASKAKAPAKTGSTSKSGSTRIKPLGDRIVVRPAEDEVQMRGGIYLPDTAKEKPQEGNVLAVGPGRVTDEGRRIAMTIKVGDRVMYSKYGGTEVKDGGEELLILRESDVLAKMG